MKFTKDPSAVLDYAFDWTKWLADGETITAAEVTVETGLTKDSQTLSGGRVTVWLSGGTENITYEVICHITTSQDRQDYRRFLVEVRNR